MTHSPIDGATLNRWLLDAEELAVLDVRAESAFTQHGAPLFASNLPVDQLPEKIAVRVPRKNVRVVLADGDDGAAERAASHLGALGYSAVHVLRGGVPAWAASGYSATFSVPPPLFTAQVRTRFGIPAVLATELDEMYRRGTDVGVLACRPGEA